MPAHGSLRSVAPAVLLGLPLLLAQQATAQDPGKAPHVAEASWIWAPEAGPEGNSPEAFLRRKFALQAQPEEATIALTADNGFVLYVNNQQIAEELDYGGAWRSIERFRIEQYLTPGANIVAIKGENLGGPGGVLAAVYVRTRDAAELHIVSDKQWLATVEPTGNWTEPDHDDTLWKPARELAKHGAGPWGPLQMPEVLTDPKLLRVDRTVPGAPPPPPPDRFTEPGDGFGWPAGVLCVAGKAPVNSTPVQTTLWPINGSRAFFEYDTPAPAVSGHRLYAMVPAEPGAEPRLLLDAGKGLISSPTCSYDGTEIIFAMAPEGGRHFHIYRMAADGTGLVPLTQGPWHDYDPAYLPDGRIVFASTRIGCREEYHANTARSLFTLSAGRGVIEPLTYHIVADTEPEVAADGRIVFVRQDNFMERAKVETHIHCVYPDGTQGEVRLGPDRAKIIYDRATGAEEPYAWLRNLGFGCPAPLPDGRIACISHLGLTMTGAAGPANDVHAVKCDITPFDISPLPDGRLLATTRRGVLAIVDLDSGRAWKLLETEAGDMHSVTYLGPRPKPFVLSRHSRTDTEDATEKAGYLLCQSAFDTQQTDGDWRRVKAIRVVQGNPFTLRPAQHQYAHIGTEAIELGDVPLAPDGSFCVRVPADRPLFLQAVDAEGRAVVNEMSWIYVRPGETRSCVGCHAPRRDAPSDVHPLAAGQPPVDLLSKGHPHRFRANNAANGGVLNLQFDRFREVASIDLHTQSLLKAAHDPAEALRGRDAEVTQLLARLKGGDAPERRTAARRLGIFRDRAATTPLSTALSDEDSGVRCASALALSACGTRDAVPALLGALEDGAPEVAQAAHVALEHLTGHSEPFDGYALAASRSRQAEAWRRWIGDRGWETIEQDLIACLASDDPIDRHLAIEALGHVGREPAKVALRAYVEAGHEESLLARLAAIRALGHLRDERAIPLLKGIIDANIGDVPGVPFKSHEFGWQAPPDHLAGAAAEALGWIGTAEAETALIEAFGKLKEFWFYTFRTADHSWLMGCHSSIPHYRVIEALDAIGSRRTQDVIGALLRAVPMDPDRGLLFEDDAYETVTARVIHRSGRAPEVIETCLSVLGDERAAPAADLRDAVAASPPAQSVGALSPASRAAQLLCVVVLNPEYAPRIRAAFERHRAQGPSGERSWVCFFLARALGKLRDGASVPALCSALADDARAIDSGVPDPPNVFLHNAMTPLYRAAVADALGRIGAPEAYPCLLAAVKDTENSMDVRQAAACALSRTGDESRLPELTGLAAEYPEVTTQNSLWEACATIRAHSNQRLAAEHPAR